LYHLEDTARAGILDCYWERDPLTP
jgi:hypothetical protein